MGTLFRIAFIGKQSVISKMISNLLRDLSENEVNFVLDASALTTAQHANPLVIVPSLDVDNLHRLARYFDKFSVSPLSQDSTNKLGTPNREWTPFPVSVRNLQGLFQTLHGLLQVLSHEPGVYDEYRRNAAETDVNGVKVWAWSASAQAKTSRKIAGSPHGSEFQNHTQRVNSVVTEEIIGAATESYQMKSGHRAFVHFHEAIIDDPGYRSSLTRCGIEGRVEGFPTSVVVKRSNRGREYLINEWAASEFLSMFPELSGLVPRFHGGNAEAGVIVMEDLGDIRERDLASYLVGTTAASAKDFLIRFAELIGTIQGVTASRVHEFHEIRTSLQFEPTADWESDPVVNSLHVMRERCESVGIHIPSGFDIEIEEALHKLQNPGPFLAFSSGDFCSKNAVLVDGRIVTFDFERARLRHALIDGISSIRHLCCLYAGCIPEDIQIQMDAAYRGSIISGYPAAADDHIYHSAVATASAGWLAHLLDMLPEAERRDKRRGSATFRQRILAGLDAFQTLSERISQLPNIAIVCKSLASKLGASWQGDEIRLPLFTAFEKIS